MRTKERGKKNERKAYWKICRKLLGVYFGQFALRIYNRSFLLLNKRNLMVQEN
jgi:hypothetical protein